MTKRRVCRDCDEEFVWTPDKPGFINQCADCATDVPKLGGVMNWEHKTAPAIQVVPMTLAKAVSAAHRRVGMGVIRAIVEVKH